MLRVVVVCSVLCFVAWWCVVLRGVVVCSVLRYVAWWCVVLCCVAWWYVACGVM